MFVNFQNLFADYVKLVVIFAVLSTGYAKEFREVQQKSTAEDSVNVVLAIDCSGSMLDYGKMESAKIAAKTFVDLLRPNDAIGVISFNDSAKTEFSLIKITSDLIKTNVRNAIDSIKANGSTSIASGIQKSVCELQKADPEQSRAMIVLSDGKENVPPFVKDILPFVPDDVNIYTIGLGWNVDGALMNQIAAGTGGIYVFSSSASELQNIYMLHRAHITKQQTLTNFSGTIAPGEKLSHVVMIDSLASALTAWVTFQEYDVDFELTSPSRIIINPQNAPGHPNVTFTEYSTIDIYSVNSPEAGPWTLTISGSNIDFYEYYSATVQVSSELEIDVKLDQDEYRAGTAILIKTILSENNQPILHADIAADVIVPEVDSNSYLVPLYDDGFHNDGAPNDGIYANYFHNTLNEGNYTFKLKASGKAPQGGEFIRENRISTYVFTSAAPAIVEIAPGSCSQGETINLSLEGANFTEGVEFTFSGSGINIDTLSVINTKQMQARITVAQDAEPGFRDLIILGGNGQQGFVPILFRVTEMPTRYELFPNYPNPFNPTTTITYDLPELTKVQFYILNILGQRVRTLVDSEMQVGFKSVIWDGRDDHAKQLASGVYFYQLITTEFRKTRKLLLLR